MLLNWISSSSFRIAVIGRYSSSFCLGSVCRQQQIIELMLLSALCYLLSVFSVYRYHLQALRHLYVLAAEPRLLVPVDVDTNMPCYALLEVTYKVTFPLSFVCDFITTHPSLYVKIFQKCCALKDDSSKLNSHKNWSSKSSCRSCQAVQAHLWSLV